MHSPEPGRSPGQTGAPPKQGAHPAAGGDPDALLTALGSALLREDRNFHTVQMVEASFRQWEPQARPRRPRRARYLAAHAPTVRAQGQTFSIAHRLHRGERLYDEE